MKSMKYRCVTCGLALDDIPKGAVQITPNQRRVNGFRFANGTVHHLRQLKVSARQHRHLHKLSKKTWCEFCFPSLVMAEPEPPVEELLVQEVIQAPVPEPIMVEEVKVVAEIEDELAAITSLSMAFNQAALRRSKQDSR